MTERLSSRNYLLEHCGTCDGSGRLLFGNSVWPCADCDGTGRRLRHTHDAASGIDGHDYAQNEGTTTKGQVNRSGETVASEAPPTMQHGAEASGSDRVGERKRGGEGEPIGAIRAARAGTGDRADDLPAPMPEVLSDDPHRAEFYRVGQTGVEPMPAPKPDDEFEAARAADPLAEAGHG